MGNAFITARKVGEDATAGGISQGGEGSVQFLRRIFNHLVKYVPQRFPARKFFFAGL
jgi:hypothetical protein